MHFKSVRAAHIGIVGAAIIGLAASRNDSGQVSFLERTIDTLSHGNAGLFAADIDGDGDTDFVTASIKNDEVAWWRNDGGYPVVWTKQAVSVGFEGALYVHAADLDGDSLIDIVATGGEMSEEGMVTGVIGWWRNGGGDPIEWESQTVTSNFLGVHAVVSGDFDGDGHTDLLVSGAQVNRLSWWRNSGSRPVVWAEYPVTREFPATQTVQAVDIDGDGRIDVLGGSGGEGKNSNQVAWWRNEGGDAVEWTKQTIAEGFNLAHWVHAADVDGDGRIDVLGATFLDNEIAWWHNGGGHPVEWTRYTVDVEFVHPLTVCAADMDNDGDMDVLGTAWVPESDVTWWEHAGSYPGITWRRHTLSEQFLGAWPILATDLDGDGDTDVLAGGDVLTAPGEAPPLTWWENTGGVAPQTGYAEVPAGRLYYEAAGSGDEIVLVHGNTGDRRHWDLQFETLAQHYRVIRYDVRGYGLSSVPVEGHAYTDFDDLAALLDQLGIEKAHVAGWSMGSGIAIDFAIAHPEMVKSLICVGPWINGYSSPGAMEMFEGMGQVVTAMAEGGPSAAVDALMSASFLQKTMRDSVATERFRSVAAEYSFWGFANPSPQLGLNPGAMERLAGIRAPTLVLVGEHDVPACLEIADLLDDTVSDSRKVVLTGTGHMMQLEMPARVKEAIVDFLRGIATTASSGFPEPVAQWKQTAFSIPTPDH